MLDFRLDTFLEVCRWMNFTKAAQALHITQPAVSQHIRYLEQLYGVRLFDYQGKRPVLTEAGQTLLSAATTMKHDTLVLQERMQTLGKGHRSLLFGVTLTIGDFVAPVPLAHYLRQNPEADVRLSVANTHELLRRLDAGEIDFAIVEGFFEKREYESLPFSREAYLAVCGVQHPIPEAPCQMEDLLGERLLLREPGSGTREILERFLEGRNLTVRDFRRTAQVGSLHAIKTLVRQGCGITFLYEAAVREELEAGLLRRLPVEGFPLSHDFTFLWRRGSLFAAEYRAVFEQLQPAAASAAACKTATGATGQPQNRRKPLTIASSWPMV